MALVVSSNISTTTKIKSLWKRMSRKAYRDSFSAMAVNNRLSSQIYALRSHRDWTQTDLSKKTDMRQARISKLESDCEAVNLKTLHRLANAFDVALVVKFVPFSELAHEVTHTITDRKITSFEQDSPFRKTTSIFMPVPENNTYITRIVSAGSSTVPRVISGERKEKSYVI